MVEQSITDQFQEMQLFLHYIFHVFYFVIFLEPWSEQGNQFFILNKKFEKQFPVILKVKTLVEGSISVWLLCKLDLHLTL